MIMPQGGEEGKDDDEGILQGECLMLIRDLEGKRVSLKVNLDN